MVSWWQPEEFACGGYCTQSSFRSNSFSRPSPCPFPLPFPKCVCRCPRSRTLSRHTAAVHGRCLHPRFTAPVSPCPAFGDAQARHRSVHFPQGQQFRNRKNLALEENDLGGLRHQPRLVREGIRRALPPLTLSASPLNSGRRRRTTSRMALM